MEKIKRPSIKILEFEPDVTIYSYYKFSEKGSSDYESKFRIKGETFLNCKPRNELLKFQNLLKSVKQQKMAIIFGNLGRHIQLLTFFMDFCFQHDDVVAVVSKWKTNSPYQCDMQFDCDVLFLIEPSFKECLNVCDFNAKHVIVLTSHLNLIVSKDTPILYYQIGNPEQYKCLAILPTKAVRFIPPVLYDSKLDLFKGKTQQPICIKLTKCESVHETYLRLLTGKEMVGSNPYYVQMSKDHRSFLKQYISREETSLLFDSDVLNAFYLQDIF